ncbi:Uncharacterized protein TPS_02789 [Trichinella pseudospiralis]
MFLYLVVVFLFIDTHAFRCPDNSYPIQHCPRGRCSTGYYCYMGWCCIEPHRGGYRRNFWYNNNNYWHGNICPTCGNPSFAHVVVNQNFGYCPDGSRSYSFCRRGICPGGRQCINGVCCVTGWYRSNRYYRRNRFDDDYLNFAFINIF